MDSCQGAVVAAHSNLGGCTQPHSSLKGGSTCTSTRTPLSLEAIQDLDGEQTDRSDAIAAWLDGKGQFSPSCPSTTETSAVSFDSEQRIPRSEPPPTKRRRLMHREENDAPSPRLPLQNYTVKQEHGQDLGNTETTLPPLDLPPEMMPRGAGEEGLFDLPSLPEPPPCTLPNIESLIAIQFPNDGKREQTVVGTKAPKVLVERDTEGGIRVHAPNGLERPPGAACLSKPILRGIRNRKRQEGGDEPTVPDLVKYSGRMTLCLRGTLLDFELAPLVMRGEVDILTKSSTLYPKKGIGYGEETLWAVEREKKRRSKAPSGKHGNLVGVLRFSGQRVYHSPGEMRIDHKRHLTEPDETRDWESKPMYGWMISFVKVLQKPLPAPNHGSQGVGFHTETVEFPLTGGVTHHRPKQPAGAGGPAADTERNRTQDEGEARVLNRNLG